MEVISEGYYIGSDDPSKTVRAMDAYQSGIEMLDDRIAKNPALSTLAGDYQDDDYEGLEQARALAQAKYEDELPDAERSALDIGYDKIKKTTDEYGIEGFDKKADEFINSFDKFFDQHSGLEDYEVYGRAYGIIPEHLIVKLGLEDIHRGLHPVIIVATFESVAADGSSRGPESVFISLYSGDGQPRSTFEFDGANVQNFYHSYEAYFDIEEYSGSIDKMVEDIGKAIYMDIGIF